MTENVYVENSDVTSSAAASAGVSENNPDKEDAGCFRLLTLYGLSHFAIDFACAVTVVSLPALRSLEDSYYWGLVIAYNLVAFGSQPFWGLLSDRWGEHRTATATGLVVTGLGTAVVTAQPVWGVLLLGCGNAIFHVGAGAVVYCSAPGRASGPGLFVAPGGLGLLAGIMIGLRGTISPILLLPLLCLPAILIVRHLPMPFMEPSPSSEQGNNAGFWLPILMFFLLVVTVRSFTGFAFQLPWKLSVSGVYLLAIAAFAGKATGGLLADRFGWKPVSLIMLLIAAAAGLGHRESLLLACAALFCIQTTTGVTLAGVQSLFPGRPAFAFGLPCAAIVAGAAPFFTKYPMATIRPILISACCLIAALAILPALARYTAKEA